MFHVVRDRNAIDVCPASWVIVDDTGETVWWPKKSLTTMQRTAGSQPNTIDGSWFPGKEKIVRRNYQTFEEANDVCNEMMSTSTTDESDHENINRKNTRSKLHAKPTTAFEVPKFNPNILPTQLMSTPPRFTVSKLWLL